MILGLEDLKKLSKPARTEDVELPGIGSVRLKQMGAQERMALGVELMEQEDATCAADVFAKLWFEVLCHSIVDGAGNRIFATPEGRTILEGIEPSLLMPIGLKALNMHGFTESSMKKALEDAKKNSPETESGTLPTTLPETLDSPAPIIC